MTLPRVSKTRPRTFAPGGTVASALSKGAASRSNSRWCHAALAEVAAARTSVAAGIQRGGLRRSRGRKRAASQANRCAMFHWPWMATGRTK